MQRNFLSSFADIGGAITFVVGIVSLIAAAGVVTLNFIRQDSIQTRLINENSALLASLEEKISGVRAKQDEMADVFRWRKELAESFYLANQEHFSNLISHHIAELPNESAQGKALLDKIVEQMAFKHWNVLQGDRGPQGETGALDPELVAKFVVENHGDKLNFGQFDDERLHGAIERVVAREAVRDEEYRKYVNEISLRFSKLELMLSKNAPPSTRTGQSGGTNKEAQFELDRAQVVEIVAQEAERFLRENVEVFRGPKGEKGERGPSGTGSSIKPGEIAKIVVSQYRDELAPKFTVTEISRSLFAQYGDQLKGDRGPRGGLEEGDISIITDVIYWRVKERLEKEGQK
jgi:hypothetical protein